MRLILKSTNSEYMVCGNRCRRKKKERKAKKWRKIKNKTFTAMLYRFIRYLFMIFLLEYNCIFEQTFSVITLIYSVQNTHRMCNQLVLLKLIQLHFTCLYRSTSRYADLEKPKKKKTLSATTSLVSIPNTIKLSMLNSGLLSFGKW